MKTSLAKISPSELETFKSLVSRPDGRLTGGGLLKVIGKPKKLPRKKVRAADHPQFGPIVRDVAGLNEHGATGDAFSDHEHSDPPARSEINDRELGRKKPRVPNNGHHGATPADQPPVSWGIGQPQRPETTTVTQPQRAPGHSSYFRHPPQQPQSSNAGSVKLSMGTGDDLRKQAATFRRIRQGGGQ